MTDERLDEVVAEVHRGPRRGSFRCSRRRCTKCGLSSLMAPARGRRVLLGARQSSVAVYAPLQRAAPTLPARATSCRRLRSRADAVADAKHDTIYQLLMDSIANWTDCGPSS